LLIYEEHDNIKLQFQGRRVFETETQIFTPITEVTFVGLSFVQTYLSWSWYRNWDKGL